MTIKNEKLKTYATGVALMLAIVGLPILTQCDPKEKPKEKPVEPKVDKKVAPQVDLQKLEPTEIVYEVQAGDTLSEISERFYKNWVLYPDIAKANGIKNPHLIYPKQKIVLRGDINGWRLVQR